MSRLHSIKPWLCAMACTFVASSILADDASDIAFFERRIRPVLVRHCYECHSHATKEPKGGLLLDSRGGIRKGGETGPSVVPSKVADSLLIEAIRHESLEMPPKEKLPDAVVADFVKWVEMGAPDPRDTPPDANASAAELWKTRYEERLGWWSLQPVVQPEIPDVRSADWSDQPIDRFILAKLEEQELHPAESATRRTLIRRLSFVLTGLPPKPSEVRSFIEDDSPGAYQSLVDRLLDSSHFGERWARHWMDVVRYTDTYGYEWDMPAKGSWRYRDYLTRAFNNDVPFDQLVREQIAGDLLESPRINEADQINESLVGPMFFQMGENRHGDSAEFNGIHQEMLDNKIDAFSKAFQAMTIACARCHDHKLDAVAQREYYALAGSFMSSRWVTNTVDLPQRNADVIAELQTIKAKLRQALASLWSKDVAGLSSGLLASSRGGRESFSPALAKALGITPKGEKDSRPLPLEHPLHAWRQLTANLQTGPSLGDLWNQLATKYKSESEKRAAHNKAHFKIVVDFRDGIPRGWSVDGVGLREITAVGDFVVSLGGESAIDRILPGGLFTNVLSPRLNGAVRTPYLRTFGDQHVSFECSGGDFGARRTVFSNAFLTEKQVYLNHANSNWDLMSTIKGKQDGRVYIEFATKTSNPNFPPRVGLGGPTTKEQEADPRSWFGITRVALHVAPSAPQDELARFASLFAGDPPKTLDEAAAKYAAWFESAVQTWAASKTTPQHVDLLNWLLSNKLLSSSSQPEVSARRAQGDESVLANAASSDDTAQANVAKLVAAYRATEKKLAIPWTVHGMADVDEGYNYPLNIRGDYDQLGDDVPRGYVECLTRSKDGFKSSTSGRRELAEYVASPKNQLTARVYVNRVWHWMFGTGIVATPSDFGHLGDPPSHPELLDYLTAKFVEGGWSTKKLIRSIVMSQTWQQAGSPDETALQVDPRNRLLHHHPLRRLEAEAIRDAMLAVSGRLDPQLFGPPINPARPHEDAMKRLFSGPVDGNGRRSIYTKITIMEPPKFLSLFNQPEPKIPTGKRDVTNTPAQSLTLLNDPFVKGQAEHWAKRLVARPHASVEARLGEMFQTAYARELTDDESQRWIGAVNDLASLHQVSGSDALAHAGLWRDIAHAIFNTKEFVYVR